MLRFLALMALTVLLPAQTAPSANVSRYQDHEAYEVYAGLLASPPTISEKSDLAVILQRTMVIEDCFKPDDHWLEELTPVVNDYKKINESRWDLVDALIPFPHKLVSADENRALFAQGPERGWKRFHRKYPHRALLSVSAVGFSADRQVAMVATESDCGPLCGSGGVSFLRKIDGVWKEFHPSGTICVVSH